MIEVSIVIPTYNRLDTLQHVIPSLLIQDLTPGAFEIIIADSNSNDGTKEYLAEVARDHAVVRHLPGPYSGRAMARNAGIAAARGNVILFTDADIIASPTLAARHLEHHRRERGIAVVGLELQVKSYDDYLVQRENPAMRRALHPSSRKTLRWLYFLTGNASVRRADLQRVGGFDEDFTGYGHEDLELGFRLAQAGIPIRYEPDAVNYHWHPVPHSEQKGRMELAGRSTVRFYRKHPRFSVQAQLGMTPLSLGLHSVLRRTPGVLNWFDERAPGSKFARNLVQQYHYVSGIKAALAE
ncbi:MAG: glycosyltransferase [Candidatus Eremiobacteraeota bacterium]|nr:glycosyltransferase [Candidatus Eremiobacteraeota bacterium]